MIFARVDVELRDHEKAHAAGAAMATWTWGMLWTRAKEKDGLVFADALRGAWVGEKIARKDMRKLVEVGLARVVSEGWELLGYAAKNELKVQIDARRRAEAERKAAWRSRGNPDDVPPSVPPGHDDLSLGDTVRGPGSCPEVCPAGVPLPESESESESDLNKPSLPAIAPEVPSVRTSIDLGGVRPVGPDPSATPFAVMAPPPWVGDAVETVALTTGIRVDHVPSCWGQFAGHMLAEERAITPAEWQRWLTREARKQQREAARDRSRAPRNNRPALQQSATKAYEESDESDLLEAAKRGAEKRVAGSAR